MAVISSKDHHNRHIKVYQMKPISAWTCLMLHPSTVSRKSKRPPQQKPTVSLTLKPKTSSSGRWVQSKKSTKEDMKNGKTHVSLASRRNLIGWCKSKKETKWYNWSAKCQRSMGLNKIANATILRRNKVIAHAIVRSPTDCIQTMPSLEST